MSFKDEYRCFQEICREISIIRNHNLPLKQDEVHKVLFFAEATLYLLALERFLRIIPEIKATDNETLYNLLDRAFIPKDEDGNRTIPLLYFFNEEDKVVNENEIKKRCNLIREFRNRIAHGNFEQRAEDNNCSYKHYFKSGMFISEVEEFFKILNDLLKQIDVNTGISIWHKNDPK